MCVCVCGRTDVVVGALLQESVAVSMQHRDGRLSTPNTSQHSKRRESGRARERARCSSAKHLAEQHAFEVEQARGKGGDLVSVVQSRRLESQEAALFTANVFIFELPISVCKIEELLHV